MAVYETVGQNPSPPSIVTLPRSSVSINFCDDRSAKSLLAASLCPGGLLSVSQLSGNGRNSSDMTLQVKEKLIGRHLVTPANFNEVGSESDPWHGKSSSSHGDVETEKFPSEEASRRTAAISEVDDIFSTSHKLVGGAFVRDIYKWHEDLAEVSSRKRTKSLPHIYAVAPDNGSSVNAHSGKHDSIPPPLSEAMPDICTPGGFRRHFVKSKARSKGKSPAIVTHNFLDFLALYGHFAGDYLRDEDDEYEDEEAVLPFPEPGLPPVPPRPLSERSPLLPTLRQPSLEGGTASTRKIVFLLMKSFIGTGVLFLPKAFYNGGLLFSSIFLCVISSLCLYAMLLLLECRKVIRGSFGDIGGVLFGPRMRTIVLSSIVTSQLGFCCAYFIFVSQNVRDLVASLSNCRVHFPEHYAILSQLFLYIPVSMVRKIKNLGFLALIADAFILLGLGYLYSYDIQLLSTVGMAPIQNFNYANAPLFIGTAVFTFEGIGLVLPIAESMKEVDKFPNVLASTMAFVTLVFVTIGALGYATFGSKVETVVLLNLPSNDPAMQTIQLLYSFAILFSVPLQLYPAVRIMESGLWIRSGKASSIVKWQKNAFRACVCLLSAAIAYAGSSNLDRFVALIGSFACIPLSFIYPALFHLQGVAKTRTEMAKDIALFIFGVLCMVYVTYQTIQSWVHGGSEIRFDRCAPDANNY